MTLAEAACATAVQEQCQPTLEAEAKTVLGKPERGAWFEYAADPTSGAPNLLFHYPSHQPTGWKRLFFGSAWANYETARPGSFHLLPSDERLPALRRDFAAMRDMYLAEPPSFDAVLTTLSALERRLNEP